MRVTFINVGYGDAVLFQAESGYTALLDGGSALPAEFAGDPYRIPAAEYLKSQGISHIDDLMISHIHEDHVCGLEPILEQTTVGRLFVPYPTEPFLGGQELHPGPQAPRSVPLYTNALNAYRRILLRAVDQSVPVTVLHAGDALELTEGLTVRVLAPKPASIQSYMELVENAYKTVGGPARTTALLGQLDGMSNHTSLLLRFELEQTVLLAAADSCPRQWNEVPDFLLENVNVLKLPHHGQIDSISEHFMAKMPLSHVITTASSDRRYNSANPAVYERLSAMAPAGRAPSFLFTDEREYPPYFSQPEGFQAVTLVMDSGGIRTEFIKINKKENSR